MDLSCETQIRLGGPNSLLMICLEPTDGVLRLKTRTCGFACMHWLPTITGCQHSQGLTSIKLMMPACTSCQHINTTNFSRSDKALVHTGILYLQHLTQRREEGAFGEPRSTNTIN